MSKGVNTIRLAGIVRESIVDGPGFRFAVFCQGCPHNCPECHNQATHDFNGGKDVAVERLLEEIEKNPLLAGVTFTGGEPFCQPEGFHSLAKGVKERGLDIVTFTGYTYEHLMKIAEKKESIALLLDDTDLLIDGPYIKAEKDLTLPFRGSRNQRLIDMNATRKEGKVVLAEQYD
ncbi:anaerobic ribonucleoside-triphosphate reductase activating protein [Ihubacter massiliensis]|uniref:Anaerobic ribonucleoside-triphosphate reductase-activating protein n=1 Tax=Hominibacterium faecale TaxID=2839743 RepID=A0A9J6QTN6_9FIRM|nr:MULTISPECIES: anaerobic ribonucleoside-triphosphate reductase activating protein [Eubacteriales Family XIII. Incertae Sedis]MCO7121083.1 anaerobic ribonucleoside-triphosphate reductase activating protein [Ihubacter massiliensis]MCU7377999.1 anaerobic ribonucleoside-triphosphate reductase activating protein [Hominibacterium faecale]